MTATQIPDKFHFKIGEVSRILGVKPYVLRFWETEFRITPAKNQSQHRVYKRQEVETLLEIKRLLYDERFTIEGARVKLKERVEGPAEATEARSRRKPVPGDAPAGEKRPRKIKGDT